MDAFGRRKLVAAVLVFFLLIIGLIGEAMQDRTLRNGALAALTAIGIGIAVIVIGAVMLLRPAGAHDHNRPDLNDWYHGLHAESGAWCCDGSDFDTGSAKHLSDVDWDSHDGHYRVRLDGAWIDVPDSAVINKPNFDGRAMVWPYYVNGELRGIRCFMPGAGT